MDYTYTDWRGEDYSHRAGLFDDDPYIDWGDPPVDDTPPAPEKPLTQQEKERQARQMYLEIKVVMEVEAEIKAAKEGLDRLDFEASAGDPLTALRARAAVKAAEMKLQFLLEDIMAGTAQLVDPLMERVWSEAEKAALEERAIIHECGGEGVRVKATIKRQRENRLGA